MRGRTAALVIVILLILAYWFTRTQELLRFPVFLDETVHILWARDVYDLRPLTGAANGKLFGLWWMAAMGLDGDGVFFVIRAATILFQTLTLAVLFSLGRYFAGIWGGLLVVALYLLAPYAFFYDRLALVDSYVATFGVLTAWFAVRAAHNGRRSDALLAGVMLVGAILAKASGVMLWIVPLLAYLLMGRSGWRARILAAAYTYAALLAIWLPINLFLQSRGYSYFSTATTVVGSGVSDTIAQRLWNNLVSPDGIVPIDVLYFSSAFLLLALIAALFLLLRRWRQAVFLLGALALPLGGLLAFADKLSPRYFHFHVPFALLLVAVGVVSAALWLRERVRLPLALLPLLVLGGWGVTFAVPFHQQYFRDPSALSLPSLDRLEYIQSDAAGFGVVEAAQFVADASAHNAQIVVVGLLPQCDTLARSIPALLPVSVECPLIRLDGSSQSVIDARIAELAQTLPETAELWLAYDRTPYITVSGIAETLTPLRVFPRPGGLTQVELLRVERETAHDQREKAGRRDARLQRGADLDPHLPGTPP